MEQYFGHFGGVLVFLEYYRGILEFWYYNKTNDFFPSFGQGPMEGVYSQFF